MYACICHAVTDAEVGAAVATGADSVKEIRRATGAGASCGSCVKRLSCMLSAYRKDAADPQAETGPAVAVPAAGLATTEETPLPAQREHLADCPAAKQVVTGAVAGAAIPALG